MGPKDGIARLITSNLKNDIRIEHHDAIIYVLEKLGEQPLGKTCGHNGAFCVTYEGEWRI